MDDQSQATPTSVSDQPTHSLGDKVWRAAILSLGTTGFIGLIPPRIATFTCWIGVFVAIGLHALVGWTWYLPALAISWLVGIFICQESARILADEDPSAVIYDEVTTVPLVFFLAPNFSWQVIVIGYLLHRLFDGTKPMGIKRVEQLPGGVGIMFDDVLAGVYALACMHLLYVLVPGWFVG